MVLELLGSSSRANIVAIIVSSSEEVGLEVLRVSAWVASGVKRLSGDS